MLRWLTLAFAVAFAFVIAAAPVTAASGDRTRGARRDAGAAHRSAAVSHAGPGARLAHRRDAGNSGGGRTPPFHLLQPRAQPGNAAGNSLRDPGGANGGWYQRGFGGNRDPGWGYGFGPTLGGFGR
jgi:hypothetical protein